MSPAYECEVLGFKRDNVAALGAEELGVVEAHADMWVRRKQRLDNPGDKLRTCGLRHRKPGRACGKMDKDTIATHNGSPYGTPTRTYGAGDIESIRGSTTTTLEQTGYDSYDGPRATHSLHPPRSPAGLPP